MSLAMPVDVYEDGDLKIMIADDEPLAAERAKCCWPGSATFIWSARARWRKRGADGRSARADLLLLDMPCRLGRN